MIEIELTHTNHNQTKLATRDLLFCWILILRSYDAAWQPSLWRRHMNYLHDTQVWFVDFFHHTHLRLNALHSIIQQNVLGAIFKR